MNPRTPQRLVSLHQNLDDTSWVVAGHGTNVVHRLDTPGTRDFPRPFDTLP
ncbi:hypothetical protein [Lentzea aerocolonigenes]|uniref:hypothetical protein n=1 Tax=Lentzea aerocolonigenes TaxID=68170 RepID=UPI0012E159FC|nr:hypothetical protein [Lentzea aerocolonigenes]